MNDLTITLADLNPEIVEAWRAEFARYPRVTVVCQSIFDAKADAIVSPANSFGVMDGGLDGKIRNFFGLRIEQIVRDRINREFFGELPVGLAFVTSTGDARFPYLVCAPTMRFPKNVAETINAYLAMKAILATCVAHEHVSSVVIPGLCTLSGHMPPQMSARQMRIAYERVILGEHAYSHWREERAFADYVLGRTQAPPEDLEKPIFNRRPPPFTQY